MFDLALKKQMQGAKYRFIAAAADVFPYLSPSRVLVDIHAEAGRQSTALRNISSDVVDKFASVFREDLSTGFAAQLSGSMAIQFQQELGPTLSRLDQTMVSFAKVLSAIESQKQDSVVGQIERLTDSLERSLAKAMAEMGREFREALAGSTRTEFGQVANVLGTSATVLSEMNDNFASMQTALRGIVQESRSSTSAQMRAGVEQTERLNQLVEGLMVRLAEAASKSQQESTTAVAEVLSALTTRVAGLSAELSGIVGEADQSRP